jgi:hypothetical protein
MKTKDIITLTVAVLVIAGCSFFLYRTLVPAKSKVVTVEKTTTTQTITGNIDKDTLKLITDRKDYGEAALDNIGRTNPFGPLN